MSKFLKTSAIMTVIILTVMIGYFFYDNYRERSVPEKIARIIHIEDSRQITSKLKDYLEDPQSEVRSRAALAVGRIGSPESGQLLYKMVGDSSIDVASTAAFAIGLTNSKKYASKLIGIAFDLPATVGTEAVVSAGRLADSSMTDVIDEIIQYMTHPSPDVREAAIKALFYSNAKSKAADIINLMQNEKDEVVRQAGLFTLARFKISEASQIYIDNLADPEPYVRASAIRGLGAVKNKETEHYLTIALNDSDVRVVAQAIIELSRSESKNSGALLVKKLEKETDENLVLLLLNGLRTLEYRLGVKAAHQWIDSLSSSTVIGAAVKYVATIRSDRTVKLLDSLITLDDPYIKEACAEAYGIINTTNVIPRLATLFKDEDPMVQAAAFTELVRIDSGNVDFYINQALNNKDFVMIVYALDHIKTKKLASYLPVLNTMMSRGEEIDFDIRRSIVDVASGFLNENKTDTLALELLIMGALDKNFIIRKDAIDVYKEIYDEDRYGMLRSVDTRLSEWKLSSAVEEYQTNPLAILTTNKGIVEFELLFDTAPLTVLNFIEFAETHFYEGLTFHRIVPNFVVQGGDPYGTGWGGPDYFIRCEYSNLPYKTGTVGIATSGKDTGGSQFFFTLSPQPHLEARYTIFGQVISGMDVLLNINKGDYIEEIEIKDQTL